MKKYSLYHELSIFHIRILLNIYLLLYFACASNKDFDVIVSILGLYMTLIVLHCHIILLKYTEL